MFVKHVTFYKPMKERSKTENYDIYGSERRQSAN